jgi:Zn-dependent peptidase ImmA (M78 family)
MRRAGRTATQRQTEDAAPARLAQMLHRQFVLFPPIDIAHVSGLLGIGVKLRELPPDVSGFYTVTPAGRAMIVLNAAMPESRRRFTWAHELGHHLLETDGSLEQLSADDRAEKRACDAFAAELLMPAHAVTSRLASLQGRPLRSMLSSLQATFGVSREAILNRLDDLGLWPV